MAYCPFAACHRYDNGIPSMEGPAGCSTEESAKRVLAYKFSLVFYRAHWIDHLWSGFSDLFLVSRVTRRQANQYG